MFITRGGPSRHAVLVDWREFAVFFRRRLFWRMVPPFHAWVAWSSQPPVPIAAFQGMFEDDWTEDQWKTSADKTVVKRLETTHAVESFCRFEGINSNTGWGSGNLLSSGSVLVITPPLEAVHTESKVAGSKVTFGWVIFTIKGYIAKAENMDVPPQGWEHVEARVRDIAMQMSNRNMDVSSDLIKASEAMLLEKYGDDKQKFADARAQRDADEAHYIWPRAKKQSLAVAEKKPSMLLEKIVK
jgi:hypothetical protein